MARKGKNIYRRKDGRWEARYIHHYENGKARYRYVYGESYAEVREKRMAEQSQAAQAEIPASKSLSTFDTIAKLWLAETKISVKESSYTRYYRIVTKYLLPTLGDQMLYKLETKTINGLTEQLLREGGAKRHSLSPKTVTDIVCVLKSIFKYSRENGYPAPNLKGLKYPPRASKGIKILSDENRKKMESQLMNSEDLTCLGIIFTLFTGIRIGEMCGLRWEDIDFQTSTVTIRRTVIRIANLEPGQHKKTKVVISEPKTESSVRTIPIPSFLLAYLRDRKSDDDCYLLTGKRRFVEPHQYYMQYKRYLEESGMDNHTFHELRHTFATRCVELGFDTKSLSEILGHSSITTTLSVYVHPTLQQKKQQMELLSPEEKPESDRKKNASSHPVSGQKKSENT